MSQQLKQQIRQDITQLQDTMLQLEQVEIPIKNYFANGFYAREMTMPAGVALVGKIHKSEHLCIVSKGRVKVVSEEFEGIIEAPYTYVSKPGAKRAIYSLDETVWTTVHMTGTTDLDELENELIAESYQALESEQREKLEGVS